MAGMEVLQIHSKSYLVRWVKIQEGHTISWSIQPHKKSINFGIFKHPGHGSAGASNTDLTSSTYTEDSSAESGDASKQRRLSTSRNDKGSTAIEQLRAKGFMTVEWHGKCEADKVSKGTYAVPPGQGGMYGLVFDNTFSKQVSKTATFVLLMYPTNSPPRTTHHLHHLHGNGKGTSVASACEAAAESVESLPSQMADPSRSSSFNLGKNEHNLSASSTYHVGMLHKLRRKRGQGYARRFFSLDFASCTLSYYYNRNSSALRGAIPLSLAAITADEGRREISIDSGAEIWHLKAANMKDFDDWANALEKASNSARVTDRAISPVPGNLRVKTAGLQDVNFQQEDERDWAQAEALVSRIVGTRDAVRRLTNQTAAPAHSLAPIRRERSNSGLSSVSGVMAEDGSDLGSKEGQKRPFWKRKTSSNAPQQPLQRRTSALSVPPSTSVSMVTTNGATTPASQQSGASTRHAHEEPNMHEHCAALLNDLDSVLADFSTLLANRKRRRLPIPRSAVSRHSIDSTSTAEFYDAEGDMPHDTSNIILINNQRDDHGPSSDVEENFHSDSGSVSSEHHLDSIQTDRVDSAFPAKPKSLSPLPIAAPKRRKTIKPAAVMPPSLIGFLRKNVGKDLSTISMPVSANEPTSLLQRTAEQLEYASLLDVACEEKLPVQRLLRVAAFAVSGFSNCRAKERAIRKPFNPMLGETYELIRGDNEVPGGFRFIAEKVCHRPVRIACHADSKNWSFTQNPAPIQKFWGKSAELITEGKVRIALRLQNGSDELYSWTVATAFLRNVVMGEKYVEPVGSMTVVNETTGGKAVIEFKAKGMFGGRSEDVEVSAFDCNGVHTGLGLVGTWTTSLRLLPAGKGAGEEIWHVGNLVPDAANTYGLTQFAAELNEMTDADKCIPPTDSRNRKDQRLAEAGDLDEAEKWKARLEEAQRIRRKEMEAAGIEHVPRWFVRVDDGVGGCGEELWKMKGGKEGYWEERAKGFPSGVQDVLSAAA